MKSRYILYVMKLTFWQFTIFLRYATNLMTIWNILIVVKHRESVDVKLNWRWLLKNFHFYTIFYAIIIKSITQIMVWLFVSVGSRLFLCCHWLRWLAVTNNTRWERDWCESTFYCDAIISKLNHHGLGW